MQIDLQKIEALLEPLAASLGCELVACEWTSEMGRRVLRVLLDKEGGVKVEDCEAFSRLIDPILDVEALLPEQYNLEVSSPGINRPLRKEKDFEKFVGEAVFIRSSIPLENRSNFKGLLKGVQNHQVQVEIDGQMYEIPLEKVLKANLEVDINKLLKSK